MDTGGVNRIRYDDIATLIANRRPSCGNTIVVALDGPSGSGKTTVADKLAFVTGAAVLHFDDIYPGWHGLAATPPLVRRDVLDPIAAGEMGAAHRWDWVANKQGPLMEVSPTRLLILDGVGSGSAIIRPYLSLLLWLEAPLEVRKRRALARDAGAYEPFWETWAAQEDLHFEAEQTSSHADRIIDTGA